jgi:hypothetical protein
MKRIPQALALALSLALLFPPIAGFSVTTVHGQNGLDSSNLSLISASNSLNNLLGNVLGHLSGNSPNKPSSPPLHPLPLPSLPHLPIPIPSTPPLPTLSAPSLRSPISQPSPSPKPPSSNTSTLISSKNPITTPLVTNLQNGPSGNSDIANPASTFTSPLFFASLNEVLIAGIRDGLGLNDPNIIWPVLAELDGLGIFGILTWVFVRRIRKRKRNLQ